MLEEKKIQELIEDVKKIANEEAQDMNWEERITIDPNILVGKPVIKATRLAVEFVIELLAQGWTEQEVLENYPGIVDEDIHACLAYASAAFRDEKVYPLHVP